MLIPLHLGYFIPLRNWSRERVIKMAKFQSGQIYPVPVSAHDRWNRLLKSKEESSEEEEFALNFARGGTGTRNQEQLVAPAWPVLSLSLSTHLHSRVIHGPTIRNAGLRNRLGVAFIIRSSGKIGLWSLRVLDRGDKIVAYASLKPVRCTRGLCTVPVKSENVSKIIGSLDRREVNSRSSFNIDHY